MVSPESSAILAIAVDGARGKRASAMQFNRIAFAAAAHEEARAAGTRLQARYPHVPPEEADIVVALGGDGFMLQTLHAFMARGTPIFGMNRGSVGFLMNTYEEDGLIERLTRSEPIKLRPLHMAVEDIHGDRHEALAINEVSLLRDTSFAAKIRILVDGVARMDGMICDGVLLSTPAGSTAYNNAVHGPILPLGAELLALTPISAFRPRHWRGALLPQHTRVVFEVLDARQRRVRAAADFNEVRDAQRITVEVNGTVSPTLLFDPEHNLEERIIKEQFVP